MRLIPVLTALLVSAFLYLLVIERETLLAFAGVDNPGADTEEGVALDPLADPAPETVAVMARKSAAQSIGDAVMLRGETEAARQVEVRAETSGKVVSDPQRKGAFVNSGDLLCELDPGTRQSSLDEARARLAEAQAQVPRAEAQLEEARARLEEAQINDTAASRLSEDGFASRTRVAATKAAVRAAEAGVESAKSGLESARATIQSAQAAVAAAEKEIERLTITAPFDGILESDAAELGSLLQPGALCATVIQLDPIKLVAFVPETEVDRVSVGAPTQARLAAGGGDTLRGRVTFLARAADPTTRTFRVEVEVANPDLGIRDGQTVEMAIRAQGRRAHLLPQSALTLDDEGTLGIRSVTEEQTARFMPVTILRDTPDGVWVDGLPERVDVITVGQEYVTDGVPVAPSYEEIQQ